MPVDPGPVDASRDEDAAMLRALELATHGPAHGPNPRVGCVLLAPDGTRLAEGSHAGAGTSHAEAAAVADARRRGADLRGATAVVTLEPCAHRGRTGPCTQVLLDAGVRRVLHAVDDPNPTAAGGAAVLRAAGLDVVGGLRRTEGEELLRTWLHAVRTGRPWVTVKTAQSLDGRVAAADGTSRWITSPQARAHAHAVRARADAIAVGTGTVLADDPALTARRPDGTLSPHQPLRVVVGEREVPSGARLWGAGGAVVHARTRDLDALLDDLGRREVRHLLVDGGPGLVSAFLRAGLADEVHTYVAPVLLGTGRAAVSDLGVGSIGEAVRLVPQGLEQLGPDLLLVSTPEPARTAGPSPAPPTTTPTSLTTTAHEHEETA